MRQIDQYALIAEVLHWLTEHQSSQPGLKALSNHFGLSEYHLQRTFQKFTGVSPKQFLKFLTKEQAIARLRAGHNVLDVSMACGLSGPGRLHDLMVTTEAVTPGEARRAGQGLEIGYGFGPAPFGDSMLAWTARGICFLAFCHQKSRAQAEHEMKKQWPGATVSLDQATAEQKLADIFRRDAGQALPIWLHGSPFQLRVWQALLKIPPGSHCSYGQIADHLGQPRAARAVGTAIGANPISWLIPCHRVITSLGTAGGYRWGVSTKMAMIGFEAARFSA